jgi:type I restriction enzyme S subunit
MAPSEDWKKVQLGNLVKISHGWPFKGELLSGELTGLPIVVSLGNFMYSGGFRFESTTLREYRGDYPAEYELSPGDILVVMTCQTQGGEILGIPGRIPDDGRIYLHNQRLGKVVVLAEEDIVPDYAYWLFLWKEFNRELCSSATGTKILHTAPTRIANFKFCLPPVAEQKSIARVLNALERKIELNRRMNQALEAMARAIFKSWFVDFEPLLIGRLPPAPEVPSRLDLIPEGWVTKPLDSIADFLNGLALQKFPPGDEGSMPVIKIADLRRGNTESSERAGLDVPGDYVIENGTVLFSWSGTLEVAVWTGGCGALNQHIFKVSSKEYPKWFYLYWLKEHLPSFRAIAADKATTMGHIQRRHMTQALVEVPSSDVLQVMDRKMAPLLEKQIQNSLESRTLAALRDALLPKLLSGEIRVKQAEKSVGDIL